MATRTIAADLARLLDAAAGPVYALDDKGRILFVNESCASWAGCPASELLGQQCRYHSSGAVTGAESIAAALSPPPETWMGRRGAALVTLVSLDGQNASRHVEFVPLGGDALEVAGVIAFAASEVSDPAALDALDAASARDDSSARELHDRLRRWRRTLAGRYGIDRLLGDSPAMRQVRSQVELASSTATRVTIVGPPGSGRQHVARAIHYGRTALGAGSLVPLVCPVLSMSLLESTIRTLQRTAVAGQTPRPATLLLSDVDQLSLESQEYLARCLPSDTTYRVVSTARAPLGELAADGTFRPELACALSTVEIRLPPLRARLDDLPLLAQMFVEEQNRQGSKQLAGFTPEAIDRLAAYAWPSNVDELAEVVAAAHQLAELPHITPGDLPAKLHVALEAAARPRKREETIVLEDFLARIEEELIRRAMAKAKGNKTKAARLLGMTRPRLYRRLVQLGLEKADG